MRRYDTISGILLILSIIDFAVAAPVLVQEKRRAGVDAVYTPEDAITMLGERGDELVNYFLAHEDYCISQNRRCRQLHVRRRAFRRRGPTVGRWTSPSLKPVCHRQAQCHRQIPAVGRWARTLGWRTFKFKLFAMH
jgi:hypothetical protein